MDPPFGLVAILLLFDVTFCCLANVIYPSALNTSTPNTPDYNVTASPLHHTVTSNISTPSTFYTLSENGSLQMDNISNEMLDLIPSTSGSQKTISEIKCEEYVEEIANIPEILIVYLENNNKSAEPYNLFNLCKILKLGMPGDRRGITRTEVHRGEYPHMVALSKYNSDGIFILVCGGTLISHTWILSTAHCTHGPNGAPTHARMGLDRLTDQRSGITISIDSMERHPDYNPPALYADIALMKLRTSVTFSLTIYPACLYQQYNLPLYQKEAVIIGWGVTESDGKQNDYLQRVSLSVTDNLECRVQHNTSKEIPCGINTSNMICAGGHVNTDVCHGNSGNPLQITEHFCMHHIIGINSFGQSCRSTDSYGVYTRVSHYISWIKNIVWPQQNTYPSAPVTSTPNTLVCNVTTSNTSTSSTVNKSPEIQSPITDKPLLNFVTLTNGSQRSTSELKCGEYAEEIANVTETLTEPLDDIYESGESITLLNYCKILKLPGSYGGGAIGGTKAHRGEYPHMVALGKYNSDGTFILLCGGTLVSHTWVLTAAHCTHGPNGAPTHARIGINRLTDQHYGITISIKNMVRHPDYNPPAMYADIALVELATSVKFSLVIHPACLYQQFDLPVYRSYATITGWGATEIDGEQSDYLQQVHLPVIDNLKCRIQHNASKEIPHGITLSMICAGGDVNKDACHGDSGGPLQISENSCIPHIIGVTSFGRSCGIMDSSGVYTRVSHYVSWIENVVWPQKK